MLITISIVVTLVAIVGRPWLITVVRRLRPAIGPWHLIYYFTIWVTLVVGVWPAAYYAIAWLAPTRLQAQVERIWRASSMPAGVSFVIESDVRIVRSPLWLWATGPGPVESGVVHFFVYKERPLVTTYCIEELSVPDVDPLAFSDPTKRFGGDFISVKTTDEVFVSLRGRASAHGVNISPELWSDMLSSALALRRGTDWRVWARGSVRGGDDWRRWDQMFVVRGSNEERFYHLDEFARKANHDKGWIGGLAIAWLCTFLYYPVRDKGAPRSFRLSRR